MESSNFPDAKFKTLVIGMQNKFMGSIDGLSENLHKDIETIRSQK